MNATTPPDTKDKVHKLLGLYGQLAAATPGGDRDGDVLPSQAYLDGLKEREPLAAALIYQMDRKIEEQRKALRTDGLTSVASPRALALELTQAVIETHRKAKATVGEKRRKDSKDHVSFAFIDANDFKLFNSHFGDPGGDEAIRAVGQFFKRKLRGVDVTVKLQRDGFDLPAGEDTVGRKGGDEFVVIMHCPKDDAKKRLDALKHEFSRDVTAEFMEKMKAMYPEGKDKDYKTRTKAYQAELAKKHENDSLKRAPFAITFSVGVVDITPDRYANKNFKDLSEVDAEARSIIGEADQAMKDDKDIHKAGMKAYTHTQVAAARAPRGTRGVPSAPPRA